MTRKVLKNQYVDYIKQTLRRRGGRLGLAQHNRISVLVFCSEMERRSATFGWQQNAPSRALHPARGEGFCYRKINPRSRGGWSGVGSRHRYNSNITPI